MLPQDYTFAPINESVGLLNKLNNKALDEIRKKHPDFISILEPEVVQDKNRVPHSELAIRVEVCKIALEETLKQTKDIYLPLLRKKLSRLQRIEVLTQIIIVISSSTVFGLLTQDLEQSGFLYVAYIGAGLSLVGALLTIILKQNSGEWSMNNQNVAGLFNSLINNRIKAEEILRELNVLSLFIDANAGEISELINQCNETNRNIRTIIDGIIVRK